MLPACRASDKGDGKSTGVKVPATEAPPPTASAPGVGVGQDPLASGSGEHGTPSDQEFKSSKPPVEITGAYLVAYRDPPTEGELGDDVTVFVVLRDVATDAPLPKSTVIELAEISFSDAAPSRKGMLTPDPKVPYHVRFDVPRKSLIADSIGKDRLNGAISVQTSGLLDNDLKTSVVIWLANIALQAEKVDFGGVMVRDPKAPPKSDIRLRLLASNHGEKAMDVRLTGLGDKLHVVGGTCPSLTGDVPAVLEGDCEVELGPTAVGNIARVLTLTYFNGIRAAHSSWPVKAQGVVVLGQAELDAVERGNAAFGLGAIASDGQRLLLADTRRLLVWSQIPTHSGVAPDLVLGQDDLSTNVAHPPDARHFGDMGSIIDHSAYSDGTRLFVADTANARLLIWNRFPKTTGAAADVVLGQPDFTSVTGPTPGEAPPPGDRYSFYPTSVVVVGSKLVVGEAYGNRLLIWNEVPTTNFVPADTIVPQVSGPLASDGARLFASNLSPQGVLVWGPAPEIGTEAPLYSIQVAASAENRSPGTAWDVSVDPRHGALVTDANRLLYWSAIPDRSGIAPDFVLGQPDAISISANAGGLGGSSLNVPWRAKLIGDRIVVADSGNYRVMIWPRPTTGDIAMLDIGPESGYEAGEAAAALLTVDGGSAYNFGPRPIGSETDYQFALKYSGSTPITIVGVTGLNGAFGLPFGTFSGSHDECGPVLTKSCLLTVRFAAKTLAQFDQSVRVRYENGDGTHELVLSLHGEGRYMADTVLGEASFTFRGGGNFDPHDYDIWALRAIHGDQQRIAVSGSRGPESLINIWRTAKPSINQAPDLTLRPEVGEIAQVFVAGTRLFAVDRYGSRILVWNTEPTDPRQAADLEIPIGPPDNCGSGGLHFDGTRLIHGNGGTIQIWDRLPTVSGAGADRQLLFEGICAQALTVADGKLVVADATTSRIWIWARVPVDNGEKPELYLGRDAPTEAMLLDFQGFGPADAVSLAFPSSVSWDGHHLAVADQFNHRVLVWDGMPTKSEQLPDRVIGQGSFSTRFENWRGLGAWSLQTPIGVLAVDGGLFVADYGRILRFDTAAWTAVGE